MRPVNNGGGPTMKLRFALILACMIATTAARAELVMELSTRKTHDIQHEPFWVVLTFRNTGPQDEKLVRSFGTAYDDVTYYVTPPDGKRYQYDSTVKASWAPVSDWSEFTVCLGPGEKFAADVDLTWEMRHPSEDPRDVFLADLLSRPGELRIQAVYRMPGPTRSHWNRTSAG